MIGGLLIIALTAACVLQAVVLYSLITDVGQLRGEVCHIAVTQHVVVVGCR